MAENIRLAFKGIWSHKLRSFLTMLGVIIGIASIISIVSTIKGTNEQMLKSLIGAGNNNVTVSLKQGESDYWMEAGIPSGVSIISDDQKDRIRSLNDVSDASFYHSRTYVDGVTSGDNSLNGGSIYGVDQRFLATVGYEIVLGRPFVDRDFDEFHKVALLDKTAANVLFPGDNAVGKTFLIRSEPYTVVGLVEKSDAFQPVINSISDYYMYNEQSYGLVLIPDATWPIVFNYDEPNMCVVRASRTEAMSNVGRDVAEIMQESVNSTAGGDDALAYKADDLLEKAKNRQQLSNSTNNLLIWIASIALLVGGIGVMNIMLVSVTERTSEIGLKKALGARNQKILIQFLTEAVVLTSIGGLIGVISGIIMAFVISKASGTPVAISIPSIILAVLFSMVIGVVFGMLPSVKAANLNPIDALRRE